MASGDPRAAVARADEAVLAARAEQDAAAEATALRAGALALMELGDLVTAFGRARDAVAAAVRGGATRAEGEARMLVAYLHGAQGRVRAALAEADRGIAGLDGLAAVRARSQRALILKDSGRLDDAMADYAIVVPALRRAGDDRWLGLALNNRALVHAYSGRLADAAADLHDAAAHFRELGLDKSVAMTENNLGFVSARRGDVPAALEHYGRAEAMLDELGVPVWRLVMCRAEVLLAVGLTEEANRAVQRADELAAGSGSAADVAELRLLDSHVALAAGAPERARAEAGAARKLFHQQVRPGWELMARFTELRARDEAGAPPRRLLREARETAAALAAAGWRPAELDARIVAATAALRARDVDAAVAELRTAGAARRSGSLEMRVRAWYATALLREATGDRAGARAAVRAGLAVVERYRAGLGATDLRAHVAGQAAALAEKGFELALADGARPRAVLGWAESWRAGAVRVRPVRPPDDPELAAALAEVRRLTAEEVDARLGGRPAPSAGATRAAEQRVVAASRTARTLHAGAPALSVPALVEALGDAVLVEYVRHRDRMLAITVRDGRCALHELGPVAAVATAVDKALFVLRGMAHGTGRPESGVRAGRRLEALLLAPMGRLLDERPLVLVPTGALHPAPWALLPALGGRSVSVAPSAAAWLAAASAGPADPSGRIVVAAGPHLEAAPAEAGAVAARYPAAQLFVGADATAAALLAALDGADIAHIAAHGRLRTDNPLFSALDLADGPLMAYDLEHLAAAPRVAVLPACHSGASAVRAGDEVMGLVAALLALGTRTVLAPVLPVADHATAGLMDVVHAGIAAGLQPAAALAAAAAGADRDDPATFAAAAAFTSFGA